MKQMLKNSPLFQHVGDSAIEEIVEFCRRVRYHDREMIVSEGDAANFDVFIMIDGEVEIVLSSMDHTYQDRDVVLSAPKLRVFGEIACTLKSKRSATVRSKGMTEVVRIGGVQLVDYMESNAEIGYIIMRNVVTILANRLKGANVLLKSEIF